MSSKKSKGYCSAIKCFWNMSIVVNCMLSKPLDMLSKSLDNGINVHNKVLRAHSHQAKAKAKAKMSFDICRFLSDLFR